MVGSAGERLGIGGAARAAARPHLMERRPDPAPIPGRQRRPRRRQPQVPPREVLERHRLVGGQDRDSRSACGRVLRPRNKSSAHPPATHQGPAKPAIISTARRPVADRVAVPWAGEPAGLLVRRTTRPAPAETVWPRAAVQVNRADVREGLPAGTGRLEVQRDESRSVSMSSSTRSPRPAKRALATAACWAAVAQPMKPWSCSDAAV